MTAANAIINKIVEVVINPLILLLMAIAFVVFLWGGFEFIAGASGVENREKGKRHMLWGIIGLFIMIAVFGILKILGTTLGFCGDVPGLDC